MGRGARQRSVVGPLKMLLFATYFTQVVCSPDAYSEHSASSSPNQISSSYGRALQPPEDLYHASAACREFPEETERGSGWLRADCMDVWTSWAHSIKEIAAHEEENQLFDDVSERLRRQGAPCFVDPPDCPDGAGSRTMRWFAALVYAKEHGCVCLLPKGYRYLSSGDDALYCHRSAYVARKDLRCEKVDWVEYFNMTQFMAPAPNDDETAMTIEVRSSLELREATDRYLGDRESHNSPRVQWILTTQNYMPAEHFTKTSTWNAAKRQNVRELVAKLRTSVGRHRQQPSSAGGGRCTFAPSRANIAIHVRLGDRDRNARRSKSQGPTTHDAYFDKLEEFMDVVSAAVARQGEAPPVFHVFSETSQPCPSAETAAFDEFRRWPVEPGQIEACMVAPAPDQCWEKSHGAPSCNPDRSGVFLVQGRPLFLHVGLDVENDMSCMIEADALLMGCSTFGQVAGLFSEGIKLFSTGCAGWRTARHYQMIPPTAVAEEGKMWVPVSGSWRNPKIYSERILEVAISQMFDKRREANSRV
ncbi:unnamed protein product [Scytosiphon promiscuus]